MNFRDWGPPLERSRKVIKNEYKIDHVSMHEDRDLIQRSFQNIEVALEQGPMSARAGPASREQFFLFRYFFVGDIFGSVWDDFGAYFRPSSSGFLTHPSL